MRGCVFKSVSGSNPEILQSCTHWLKSDLSGALGVILDIRLTSTNKFVSFFSWNLERKEKKSDQAMKYTTPPPAKY